MANPDARPITEDDMAAGRVRLVPRIRTLRRALRLSQQDFAAHSHIPIGALRDWEQGRKAPDAAAKAYLRVIASESEIVRKALSRRRGGDRGGWAAARFAPSRPCRGNPRDGRSHQAGAASCAGAMYGSQIRGMTGLQRTKLAFSSARLLG
jgi:putative transcriptional regulator